MGCHKRHDLACVNIRTCCAGARSRVAYGCSRSFSSVRRRALPKPPRRPGSLPLLAPNESFAGVSIVSEFPDEIGLQLWLLFRNALMWAESEPHERKGIFSEGAKERAVKIREIADPELRDLLLPLAAMLVKPGRVSGMEVRRACTRLAAWAKRRGKLGTALSWARVAATADPQSARAHYEVGRLARRRAEYHVAEVWYHQAQVLARRYGNWAVYARAFLGLGNLYRQKGDYPQARYLLERAYRVAKKPPNRGSVRNNRKHLREMQRWALHDLMLLCADAGAYRDAEAFARLAVPLFRRGATRLLAFAHDVAYLWIQRGHFARALPVIEAIVPHVHDRTDLFHGLSNLARAAGATSAVRAFERAWQELLALIGETPANAIPAASLVSAARGAASLRRWQDALWMAERAVEVAESRQEEDALQEARTALDMVRSRTLRVGGRTPHARRGARVEGSCFGAGEHAGERLTKAPPDVSTSLYGLVVLSVLAPEPIPFPPSRRGAAAGAVTGSVSQAPSERARTANRARVSRFMGRSFGEGDHAARRRGE